MDIDTRSKRTSPKPPKILGAILSLFKINMFPSKDADALLYVVWYGINSTRTAVFRQQKKTAL
jgi:hypothetical protein